MSNLYLCIIAGVIYILCGFWKETDLKELAKWVFILALAAYLFAH